MYKKPSKKKELVQRIAVYSVMSLAVLVIVTGIILFILGYRLDSNNGTLEQNALVQFASKPSGATVAIDGVDIGPRTPSKQSIMAGTHSFSMARTGYETWTKTLPTNAGTLTWLDYARLIPKSRTPANVSNYAELASVSASPDGRSILLQARSNESSFSLVDIRSDTIKQDALTLPADIFTAAPQGATEQFAIGRWDTGSRHVFIQHVYGDKTEWIVLDTQDAPSSVNVTRLFNVDMVNPIFSGTSGNILYALSNGIIRRFDLGSSTISRALVSNVASFDMYESNIVTYVGTDASDPSKRVAGVYRDGDNEAHVIATTDASTPLFIATTRYFNDDYVAVIAGSKVKILKGSYPTSNRDDTSLDEFANFDVSSPVTSLSFSSSGDFLLVQSQAAYDTYDLEHQRLSHFTYAEGQTTAPRLRWLDSAYLWGDEGGKLTLREFDGSNSYAMHNVTPGYDVSLSQNGKYLYSIQKIDDVYHLQRIRMLLD
ncbi:MAG: hypothetical protein JWN33_557 [Candidatus Saccharibacteria bacterium]|nr:hypothetical protein [Candidatus Saccharibacteria bacterium]